MVEDETETVMKEDAGAMHAQDITLSGHTVRFWKGGAGPGLLLLHAAWGDAEMSWGRVWDQLSRSYTVVAPDLPGFGRSTHLLKPSLSGMARKLKEVIDALHMNRVIVAGNSLSAAVAIQMVHEYPQAVSRLVLVNGGYMPLVPAPLRDVIVLPIVNHAFRAIIRHLTFSPKAVKRSFADPSRLPAGFLEKIQATAPAYARISFDIIMNMAEPQSKPTVPTLVVWGGRDSPAAMKQAKALQKWIPGARFVTINEAGHMPQVEQPQEFAEVIMGLAGT